MKLCFFRIAAFALLIVFFWTCKPKIMETTLHAQNVVADSEYQYEVCKIFKAVDTRWTHVCLEFTTAKCKELASTAYYGDDFIAGLSIAKDLVMTKICKRFEWVSLQ